jgi:microcystin-dependent protein
MPLRRQRLSAAPVTAPVLDAPEASPNPRRDFLARTAAALGGALLALAGRPALPGGGQARAATNGLDPFLGEIMLFAGTFAPQGYLFCEGQILPIASYTALFSLLGTQYGGNGINTFALPDLRGRAPIHAGQGPGLPNYSQGQIGGEATHTLTVAEMPQHSHVAHADTGNGTTSSPAGALPAHDPAGTPVYGTNAVASLSGNAIATTGGNQPHNVQSPYLALRWCIATQGIFPSRP